MSLIDLIVLHRGLGSQDESATLEEQGDKILFYKQDLPLSQQLSQLTMVEGLIEFTTKFSKQSIQSAMLDRRFWCFHEAEPDVWFISSHAIAAGAGGISPNVKALHASLTQIYDSYHIFSGPVRDRVDMDYFNHIQKLRKAVRKAELAIFMLSQDHQISDAVLNDMIHRNADYSSLPEPMVQLFDAFYAAKKCLAEDISSPKFTLPKLRERLSGFLTWYAAFATAADGSFVSSLPRTPDPHLAGVCRTAMVHRILRVVQQQLQARHVLVRGCVVVHDGAALWSDLDAAPTSSLLHMLCLLDSSNTAVLRDMSDDLLQIAAGPGSGSGGHSSGAGSSARSMRVEDGDEVRKDMKLRMFQDLLSDRLGRQGIATCDWRALPLEDATIELGEGEVMPANLQDLSGSGKQRMGPSSFLDGEYSCDGKEKLLFPRLYVSHREGGSQQLGRALFLLFGRLVLVVVLDEAGVEKFHRVPIEQTLDCYSDASAHSLVSLTHFLRTMKFSSDEHVATDEEDHPPTPAPSQPLGQAQGPGQIPGQERRVLSLQLVLVAHLLYRALSVDLDTYRKQAVSALEPLFSNAGVSVLGDSTPAPPFPFPRGNSVRRPQTSSPGMPLPPAFASSGGGGAPASPPPVAVGGGAGPYLGPQQSLGSGSSAAAAAAAAAAASTVCGVLIGPSDTIYLSFRAGVGMQVLSQRDMVEATIGSSSLEGVSAKTGSTAFADNVLDTLVRKYSQLRSPSMLFYSMLARIYGKHTVRILNGLHAQMRQGLSSTCCQRVCTVQKGGFWAIAHRLFSVAGFEYTLLGVIRGCATVNDLHDIFDALVREVRSLAV